MSSIEIGRQYRPKGSAEGDKPTLGNASSVEKEVRTGQNSWPFIRGRCVTLFAHERKVRMTNAFQADGRMKQEKELR